jgi:hypothetical protein
MCRERLCSRNFVAIEAVCSPWAKGQHRVADLLLEPGAFSVLAWAANQNDAGLLGQGAQAEVDGEDERKPS